jgi:hypothetical protein
MPYNRGAIRALHSTYKNMYIQQELSLSIASAINSFATSQCNMTNFIFKQVQTETDTTRILGCVDSMNSISLKAINTKLTTLKPQYEKVQTFANSFTSNEITSYFADSIGR